MSKGIRLIKGKRYLTVSAASRASGKAERTIRRYVMLKYVDTVRDGPHHNSRIWIAAESLQKIAPF